MPYLTNEAPHPTIHLFILCGKIKIMGLIFISGLILLILAIAQEAFFLKWAPRERGWPIMKICTVFYAIYVGIIGFNLMKSAIKFLLREYFSSFVVIGQRYEISVVLISNPFYIAYIFVLKQLHLDPITSTSTTIFESLIISLIVQWIFFWWCRFLIKKAIVYQEVLLEKNEDMEKEVTIKFSDPAENGNLYGYGKHQSIQNIRHSLGSPRIRTCDFNSKDGVYPV